MSEAEKITLSMVQERMKKLYYTNSQWKEEWVKCWNTCTWTKETIRLINHLESNAGKLNYYPKGALKRNPSECMKISPHLLDPVFFLILLKDS